VRAAAERATRIAEAFGTPHSYDRVHGAGFYDDAGFCEACGVPYCSRHSPTFKGAATCLQRVMRLAQWWHGAALRRFVHVPGDNRLVAF